MEKTKIYLLVLLLAIASGCNLLGDDMTVGKPRVACERNGCGTDSLNIIKSPADQTALVRAADTTVYISAVRCGPGYDWQRDTAYGCADAQILLYKNGKEVLSIPAGEGCCASAAPDMHHILDGHLYTEYCDYSKTVICRDGVILFSISGRELLKGLLARGQDIYTLSRNLSSGGLVYRKNGEELLCETGAVALGDFDDASYGEGGALYEDSGAICFAFKDKSKYYIVRDGVKCAVDASGIFDLKSIDGRNVTAASGTLGYRWKAARIWRNGNSYVIVGESGGYGENGVSRAVDAATGEETLFRITDPLIYCSGKVKKAVDRSVMEKYSFCFSPKCGALLGKELALLHTPRDGSVPYLSAGPDKTEFEGLDGYLTGLSVSISLPN